MNEFTEEQRAAVKRVRDAQGPGCGELTHPRWLDVQTILNLLPTELSEQQPDLPTEPGLYASASYGADYAWRFDDEDNWWVEGRWVDPKVAATNTPFIRLVPERPQITRKQVSRAVADVAQQFGIPTHTAHYVSALTTALANGIDRD